MQRASQTENFQAKVDEYKEKVELLKGEIKKEQYQNS